MVSEKQLAHVNAAHGRSSLAYRVASIEYEAPTHKH